MESLPEQLRDLLPTFSPSRAARGRFEARLAYGRHRGPAAADARPAAVMILLCWEGDQWTVPFTVRQIHLPDHAGQISFPGGMVEPNETDRDAVLRELEEEIGVSASEPELIGRLSPLYLFNSNYVVVPWIGCVRHELRFVPEVSEVADVFTVPLKELANRDRWGSMEIRRGKLGFSAPCIQWQQHQIWGATAMVLGEFLEAVELSRFP